MVVWEIPCESLLHYIVYINILPHAVHCKSRDQREPIPRLSGASRRKHLGQSSQRKGRPMSKCSIPIAVLFVAAAVSGCDKPAPTASQARPVRTVTVEQRAAGETVSLTGQVRAKDQAEPRLSPRRTHDRAARQCGRCRSRQAKSSAGSTRRIQQNALRSAASQPLVGRGAAERGAHHFLATAGAAEGRLDVPCQLRQRPARLRDAPGPGRRRAGAGAHRAGSAELHGLGRPMPRVRSPRSVPNRAKWSVPGRWSCNSRARAGATPCSTSPSS